MRSDRTKRNGGNEGEPYIFLRKMRSDPNSQNDQILHHYVSIICNQELYSYNIHFDVQNL